MTQTWDPSKISSLLSRAFLSPQPTSTSSKKNNNNNDPPTATIDALITFDASGVSGHPNHISLYHGSRHFLSTLQRGRSGWAPPVDLYVLTSVSIARKYTGFLDVFATILSQIFANREKSGRGNPGTLVSVSALAGGRESYGAARTAMTQAHKSQMVWFRWGWIALSRYMYVNDLRLERVKS